MPFIDPEKLEEIYFPPAKIYAIQRLGRQRRRLESERVGGKVRIGLIVDGYFPMVRKVFSDPWSAHTKAFLTKVRRHCKINPAVESHMVYLAAGRQRHFISSPVLTKLD